MSAGEGVLRGIVPTLEHLPVPAFALNASGVVIAWNPALARLTGIADVAMVGKGNGAHAFPFLGATGPLLSDILLDPSLEVPRHLSAVEPDGPGLSARLTADLMGARRTLFLRAIPIVDRGVTIGTVEAVLEPPRVGEIRNGTSEAIARLLRTTRHDIKNELTIVLGYIGLARDAVDDPVTCVGLERAIGAAGEIGRLIDFSREVQELGDRPPEAREIGSLIRAAADAADLGGIDCRIAVPRGTITADPAVFSVLEHLFERLFLYSASTIPRPGIIRVTANSDSSFTVVYEDDAPHADRNVHPDRAFCRQLDSGLAGIRELLSLDGIEFAVTPAPLRVELSLPEDRVWTAEKKE
jgi:signal transduction histidine kinase